MNRLALAIVLAVLSVPLVRAQQAGTPAWVTVASFSSLNQKQAITTPLAIYSPTQAGLYRISYYIEAVATTLTMPVTYDYVCASVYYTGDSGQIQQRTAYPPACAESFIQSDGVASFYGGGDVFVFRSKSLPISITVTDTSP